MQCKPSYPPLSTCPKPCSHSPFSLANPGIFAISGPRRKSRPCLEFLEFPVPNLGAISHSHILVSYPSPKSQAEQTDIHISAECLVDAKIQGISVYSAGITDWDMGFGPGIWDWVYFLQLSALFSKYEPSDCLNLCTYLYDRLNIKSPFSSSSPILLILFPFPFFAFLSLLSWIYIFLP